MVHFIGTFKAFFMLKISPQNPRQEFKHRLTVLIRFLETGYFIFRISAPNYLYSLLNHSELRKSLGTKG